MASELDIDQALWNASDILKYNIWKKNKNWKRENPHMMYKYFSVSRKQ